MQNQKKKNQKNDGGHGAAYVMVPEPLLFKKDNVYLTCILFVFAAVNINGLKAHFTFDDHLAVENNQVTDNSLPWSSIFTCDFWGHRLTDIVSNDSYRPLTVFTFRLQHFLLGYHSALFLRLFNYTLAALNIVLVYYMSRILSYLLLPLKDIALAVKDKIEDEHIRRLRRLLELVPVCTAGLFAVHPVHVEAVTSIVGRSELICAALGFYAFISLHLYLHCPSKRTLAKIMVLLWLSTFGKESGVTFGAMFLVYLFTLLYLKRVNVKRATTASVLMLVFIFAYVQFRKHFIGHVDLKQSPLIRRTENPQYFIPPGLLNWWSMRWVVLMKNLELSFFPTKLSCEYSFNCIPHLSSIKDARFIPFTCVTIFFASLGLTLLYRSIVRRSHTCLAFLLCLLWYGIALSPVTHIFVKVGTFVAERCLYIPSFAVVHLVVVGVLLAAGQRGSAARVQRAVAALACLAVWWTWMTVRRNEDWYDDASLFQSNLQVCKTSGKAHYQYALTLTKQKGVIDEEARELMETAMAIDDDFYEPLYDLAYYDYLHNDYKAAHAKARRCVMHPITSHKCNAIYDALCKMLFPNMKRYEALVDLAEGSPLVIREAKSYCMAGLAAMQEADAATAASIFYKSLVAWNKTKDTDAWMEEREEPLGENTYCNALYWYTLTFPGLSESSSQSINDTALRGFIRELTYGCARCEKAMERGQGAVAQRIRSCRRTRNVSESTTRWSKNHSSACWTFPRLPIPRRELNRWRWRLPWRLRSCRPATLRS
ncbi:transmembrane and TPR repeat-containing protein 4 [Strigomonas culicis]|uniref:Transmembrane and TPR repeat-containing protein 4 n=1 Tax=Strigomonas culicis TaxID=28005 RepID=S9U754_9TRYP|nr:transmembrane and TPR repeat-containing protein 4 [Strigomonas culicis]|eukprot:EPY24594.1 transmembrane and TPR repeat-containing protein 4 [Strigomonas culicis]